MENDRLAAPAPTPPLPPKADKSDPRASLRNILADPTPTPPPKASPVPQATQEPQARAQTPPTEPTSIPAGPVLAPAPTSSADGAAGSQGSQGPQNLAAITYTLRKNANGGVSTVYSGSKIKYLKKDDGVPFWRRDIQYTFLRHVFQDKTRVFTKLSTGVKGHTFAEAYVDAMAHSSKCSQILKEKLLSDTSEQALDISMVCLLVNVGRMNTTVNFFPEMRARVRTFHSIPSLQVHQNPGAYKQLQDGPRLKSILKGAMEDTPQPSNLEEIANHSKPRTNPVSLIFVLAQYAPRVSDLHFPAGVDFFDLFMRDILSSKSRANALLWIIWWYLESDFTAEDALNNPFGSGRPSNASDAMLEGLNVMKGVQMRVPEFDVMTEEEAALENVDPPEEIEYGDIKKKERDEVLKDEFGPSLNPAPQTTPLPPIPPGKKQYDWKKFDGNKPNYSLSDRSPHDSPVEPTVKRGGIYRRYSPSPVRNEERRNERLSTSPDRSAAYNRPPPLERDSTQSGTPAPTVERRSSGGGLGSFKGTPDAEPRKGPGRGNYPRRLKTHSTQPFEQIQHLDQLGGTPSGPVYPLIKTFHGHIAPTTLPGHPPPPRPPPRTPPPGYYYRWSSNPVSPPDLRPIPEPEPPAEYVPPQVPTSTGEPKEPTSSEHPPGQSSEQPAPTKRGRQSERTRVLEQTRNDRISSIVDSNMLAIRRAKHIERKRRGVVLDAWIKARSLDLINDMWDSDDEVENLERTGGLDDIRKEGIEVSLSIPTSSGFESKKTQWNPGDMGQLASSIAKTFRKLARANGVEETVERARRRTRGSEQENERRVSKRGGAAEEDQERLDAASAIADDSETPRYGRGIRRQSPMASYPTSNFLKRKTQALAPAQRRDQSPGSVVPDDDAATITAEPTPKKKRRVLGPRKMKLSAKATALADQSRTSTRGTRGGRRAGSGAKSGRGKRKSEGDTSVVGGSTGSRGKAISLSRGGRGGRSAGKGKKGGGSARNTRHTDEGKAGDELVDDAAADQSPAGDGDVDMDIEEQTLADEGDSLIGRGDEAEDAEAEREMDETETQVVVEDDDTEVGDRTNGMDVDRDEVAGDIGANAAAAVTVDDGE